MIPAIRSTCDMLRPSLVALVYDEPHPETSRLMQHLSECEGCRQEEADLKETRSWIDGFVDRRGNVVLHTRRADDPVLHLLLDVRVPADR